MDRGTDTSLKMGGVLSLLVPSRHPHKTLSYLSQLPLRSSCSLQRTLHPLPDMLNSLGLKGWGLAGMWLLKPNSQKQPLTALLGHTLHSRSGLRGALSRGTRPTSSCTEQPRTSSNSPRTAEVKKRGIVQLPWKHKNCLCFENTIKKFLKTQHKVHSHNRSLNMLATGKGVPLQSLRVISLLLSTSCGMPAATGQ